MYELIPMKDMNMLYIYKNPIHLFLFRRTNISKEAWNFARITSDSPGPQLWLT